MNTFLNTKLKLLKTRINQDQAEQNRLRHFGTRSFWIHLKISHGKSPSFFDHFYQLHLAIMRDGGVCSGYFQTSDCLANGNI